MTKIYRIDTHYISGFEIVKVELKPRCPGRFEQQQQKQEMRILEMNNKITKIKSLMEGLKERLDTE